MDIQYRVDVDADAHLRATLSPQYKRHNPDMACPSQYSLVR